MKHRYNVIRDVSDERDYKFKTISTALILPSSDWRGKLPPIFDQGLEGSCTSQAGVAGKEYMDNVLEGKITGLSRQFLYNQERITEGSFESDEGAMMRTICDTFKKFGVCEEKYLTYGMENLYTRPCIEAYENAKKHTISSYYRVNTLDEVRLALSQGHTVLFGMTVYDSFEGVKKDGVIPVPTKGEKILGGHATKLVGHNDNATLTPKVSLLLSIFMIVLSLLFGIKKKMAPKGYLILRNSWADTWGDNGYGYMSYEAFEAVKQDMWVMIN